VAVAVLGACLALASQATPAFDYARYVQTSLADAESDSCGNEERPSTTVDVTLAPVRFAAVASKDVRPIAEDASHLLDMFKRLTGRSLPAIEHEVRVRIDGQDRWLSIQETVLPYWRDEVGEGQALSLFATRVGCHLPAPPDGGRVIFSINEFEIAPASAPEPEQ
jgi:hypothetical protein